MNRLLKMFAIMFALFWALVILQPVPAQAGIPVTVTFKILRLQELHCNEGFPEACPNDYYAKVWIGGQGPETSAVHTNSVAINNMISVTKVIDSDMNPVPIHVEIHDEDFPDDDEIDISTVGDRALNLMFDMNTRTWTGDVPDNVDVTAGDQLDAAFIRFSIEVSGNDWDNDGIADNLELFGIKDAGGNMLADLPAMGADPCRPTIAMEIDFMKDPNILVNHSHKPRQAALDEVVAAFNAAPVLAGNGCPYAGFPKQPGGFNFIYNVDDELVEQPFATWGGGAEFIRNNNFDARLRPFFHYSLWVHNQSAALGNTSGRCCSDSKKDVLVSLGGWTDGIGSVREQSGTLMHELGHALGLDHGGGRDLDPTCNPNTATCLQEINCKPNYLSIMSYAFQTTGIPRPDGTFRLDYSGSPTKPAGLPTLNEGSLIEAAGIGNDTSDLTIWNSGPGAGRLRSRRGDGPLNWNWNRNIWPPTHIIDTVPVAVDLNNFGITGCGLDNTGNPNSVGGETMRGYADWYNLRFRAVLAAGANFEPSEPDESELTAEEAASIKEALTEALKPDPGLVISAAPLTVTTGSDVTYTIIAFNNGPTVAKDVVVTENLPAYETFVSCSATGGGTCGGSGNNLSVTFTELAPDAFATITIVVTVNCAVPDAAVVANTVTIASSTPDANSGNNSATANVTASNPPPVISNLVADQTVLWPPNHTMQDVNLSYTVTDNCGTPSLSLNVTSNEPVNGIGDGNTTPDWEVVNANSVRLRAERSGNGTGRVYTILVTAADSGGGSSSQQVTVSVPHDQAYRIPFWKLMDEFQALFISSRTSPVLTKPYRFGGNNG
jgi:uncharacterized repeat protein (TIGR01451 family)